MVRTELYSLGFCRVMDCFKHLEAKEELVELLVVNDFFE
jgi:hypothetical protein